MNKNAEYQNLVNIRKKCQDCDSIPNSKKNCLHNQAEILGGIYDTDQLGNYSYGACNLNSKFLLVLQDFTTREKFETINNGLPTYDSPTSKNLLG